MSTRMEGHKTVVKKEAVYAFIDGQNLNLGLINDVTNKTGRVVYSGRKLDYRKFRHYLREKYGVTQAYIFIGLIPTNNSLYTYLQECGFTLVFKQISYYLDDSGNVIAKGNVDTDIVLYSSAKLAQDYSKAVFVSGDGDFLSLYDYIEEIGKLYKILVPNRHKYSKLLNTKRTYLGFVSDINKIFKQTKKETRSSGRITSLGQPGHGDKKRIAKKPKNVNTTAMRKQS